MTCLRAQVRPWWNNWADSCVNQRVQLLYFWIQWIWIRQACSHRNHGMREYPQIIIWVGLTKEGILLSESCVMCNTRRWIQYFRDLGTLWWRMWRYKTGSNFWSHSYLFPFHLSKAVINSKWSKYSANLSCNSRDDDYFDQDFHLKIFSCHSSQFLLSS